MHKKLVGFLCKMLKKPKILAPGPWARGPNKGRFFDTTKRSAQVNNIAADGAGLRDCPLLFALDHSGDLRRVFSTCPPPTTDYHGGLKGLPTSPSEGADARAATPVGRTVGRSPLLFTPILYHGIRDLSSSQNAQRFAKKKSESCAICQKLRALVVGAQPNFREDATNCKKYASR